MAAKSSHQALVTLLIGAAAGAAASSANTTSVFLLSQFNDAEFKDEVFKEKDNELAYYFIPRVQPALPYNQCDFLRFFREELTEVNCQFHMRFSKGEIIQLAESLKLKDIAFSNHQFAPPITTLCVVL